VKRQSIPGYVSIGGHRNVRLFLGLLLALLLIATSRLAGAQEATPDDAMQAAVTVADGSSPIENTESPPASDTIETQQEAEEPNQPEPPAPTSAPTVVPGNADVLQRIDGPSADALGPGSTVTLVYTYQVTTPRGATTIVAEIGGESGVNAPWTIQLQAGGLWSDAGNPVQLTDAQNIIAGSTIPLSVVVTAPQSVTVDETITIWLSSSVSRLDGGIEQGIVASQPVASVNVTPPPTPSPTAAPILDPTLACEGPAEYVAPIGGSIQLTCEVTVQDSRAGALLSIEPPSGWTASSGDMHSPASTLELGPFALNTETPTVQTVPISLQAPPVAGVKGDLTIRLIRDSDTRTKVDSIGISLSTSIPDAWNLSCSGGSAPIAPGPSTDIACELPDDAWAFRSDHPSFAYSTTGGWAGDTGRDIDHASFSFSLALPCTIANDDDSLLVSADLGNGLTFTSSVPLEIDRSAAVPVPVLAHTGIDFGKSQWLGTSYSPSEATVILTVSGATSPCASAPWSIQLTTSSFLNGTIEIDPTIAFSIFDSTGEAVSPSPNGAVIPGSASTVASGTGDAVVVVHLTLSIPATVGAGTYTGDIEFSISTGP
jgi:hypothetical protein